MTSRRSCQASFGLFAPTLEAFLAIFQKFSVIPEMEFKAILGWGVIFTPSVIIVAADLRSGLVYPALAVFLDMFTLSSKHKVPIPFVPIELYSAMGNLPQQVIEVRFGARSRAQGLGGIGTAFCSDTAEALVVAVCVRGLFTLRHKA